MKKLQANHFYRSICLYILITSTIVECKVSQVVHGKFPVFELRRAFLSSGTPVSNHTRPSEEGGLEASASSINPRGFDFSKLQLLKPKDISPKEEDVIPLAWVDLPLFDTPTFSAFSGNAIQGPLLVVPSRERTYKKVYVKSDWGESDIGEQKPELTARIAAEESDPSGPNSDPTAVPAGSHLNEAPSENKDGSGGEVERKETFSQRLGRIIPLSRRRSESEGFSGEIETKRPVKQDPEQQGHKPLTSPRPFAPRQQPARPTNVPLTSAGHLLVKHERPLPVPTLPLQKGELEGSASFIQSHRHLKETPKVIPPSAFPLPSASSYQYQYQYRVSNLDTMDVKTHSESRQGETVLGEYSLLEPDGLTIRTVKYFADEKGFRAMVKRVRKSR